RTIALLFYFILYCVSSQLYLLSFPTRRSSDLIDFEVIRENPKIFMGYSDTTISHLFCHKAGLSSFYGPAIMVDFAENVEMDPYTIEMVNRTLFSSEVIGKIEPAPRWTSERLEWDVENKHTRRRMQENQGYEVLQGSGVVQ